MKSLYKTWKIIKKAREDKETCIRKFNEGGKAFASIKCAFNANILINNSGVLYNTTINSEYFFIPIQNIKKVQVKTDEEISRQVVDDKTPKFGGLTFKQQTHIFLIINYVENNIEVEKTIESKMAEVGAGEILRARKSYIINNPKSSIEELDYILKPIVLNEEFKGTDIPDQINKLFELAEKGIISSEEFNQKKKELLSRM